MLFIEVPNLKQVLFYRRLNSTAPLDDIGILGIVYVYPLFVALGEKCSITLF